MAFEIEARSIRSQENCPCIKEGPYSYCCQLDFGCRVFSKRVKIRISVTQPRNLFLSLDPFNKAEFAEEGTFFANRFPSLRTFVNKKVGNRKN